MYLYLSCFSDRVWKMCKSCNRTTIITLFTSCWDKGLTSPTLRIPTMLMPTGTGLLICIQHLPPSHPSSTHGPPTSQINCLNLHMHPWKSIPYKRDRQHYSRKSQQNLTTYIFLKIIKKVQECVKVWRRWW